MPTSPSLGEIERIARDAFAALPDDVRRHCASVAIRVEDWPDRSVLDALETDDPLEITGLYDGIPLIDKSVADPVQHPDIVWLYRRPILAEWAERGNVTLSELVTHVLVHELAHHLGWSDDDIAQVDRWWE